MNRNQVTSVFMAAILVAGVMTGIGFTLQKTAFAAVPAGITIKTSADNHGGNFFGESALQVIVTDDSADDTDDDTIDVTIDADGTDSDSTSITVPNTSAGSQRFEFFLVQADSTCNDGSCISDPETTGNFTDLTDDQIVTFGNGGELATGADLFDTVNDDAVTFHIKVGDEEVTVDYQDSKSLLTLDRNTYGSDSVVHIFIEDQDANNDPTGHDTLTYNATELNDLLFTMTGASFVNAGDLDFEETGDNTAKFEADAEIGGSAVIDAATDTTVQLTLHDQEDYSDLDDDANDETQSTSTKTFSVNDVDGRMSDIGDVTFASELKFTVTDNDRNTDSEVRDRITGETTVCTEGEEDCVDVDLRETGLNTGVFAPDVSNNEIKISFLSDADEDDPTAGDQTLQLNRDTMDDDIVVTYHDVANDNSDDEDFVTRISVDRVNGAVSLPETSGINDDFTFQLTDPDLNDDPRTQDSYTINLQDGDSDNDGLGDGEYALVRGGEPISHLAFIEFEIQGQAQTFDTGNCPDSCDITLTLTETEDNSGIFETVVDMGDVLDAASLRGTIDDGDKLKITYHDLFDTVSREASDELAIGSATQTIDFSRTVLPIPPSANGAVDEQLGSDAVTTQILVTDPDQNLQSSTTDSVSFDFICDVNGNEDLEQCGGDESGDLQGPGFRVEVQGDNFDEEVTIDTDDSYGGADNSNGDSSTFAGHSLDDILPSLPSLDETGKATGVFEDDFTFVRGGLTTKEFQGLQVTVVYIDESGDEESTGITFRGNDGIVTADKSSVRSGDTVVITVQDEDLNLDDSEAEEFSGSQVSSGNYLLSVETEDDEIANGVTDQTFRETGEDTGIFTAEYEIGTDIKVTDTEDEDTTVNQATNILITYNDEIDSSGRSGDELEVNVPVVSSTGAINVTPELVGPGTEIHVTITDQDLNKDSDGVDEYDGDNTGDGIVSFRTDNDDVDNDEASPKLTETGPSTGVFEFTIQLIPGKNGQDSNFADARGGSEPEVGAIPGDLLSINYDDESDSNGHSTTVSKVVEVKSFDPEFVADKETYSPGDKVTVSISDPDANLSPDVADSLDEVRVFSDSDAVGQDLTAIETGKDTGVFKLIFTTAKDSASGSIVVKNGDQLTVEYTDPYPADYADRVDNVNNPDKDFDFTIKIGSGGSLGSATPSMPQAQDIQGKPLNEVKAGQQIVLSTVVSNNLDEDQPYTAIIEVRDSNGITVFLGYGTGTLGAGKQSNVGLSFTPDNAGSYEVRTFVLSSLNNPSILSDIVKSTLNVS